MDYPDSPGFSLSPQQQRIALLDADGKVWPYVTRLCLAATGQLDIRRLHEALLAVAARHEILRTRFMRNSGLRVPVQVVDAVPKIGLRNGRGGPPEYQAASKPDLALGSGTIINAVLSNNESGAELSLTMPSLCADAVSGRILAQDLAVSYANPGELSAEPAQYADIAQYFQEVLSSDAGAHGRQYWKARLAATDRRSIQDGPGSDAYPRVICSEIPISLLEQARTRIGADYASDERYLANCWLALLSRMASRERLAIGWAMNGRTEEEFHDAVGLFERYVPVEVANLSDNSFRDGLEAIGNVVDDASEWQATFEWPDQSVSHAACFSYYDASWSVDLGGSRLSCSLLQSCTDRFEIKLSCVRLASRVALELWYNPVSYTEIEIQRLLSRYIVVARSAAQSPDAKVWALAMLDQSERNHLIHEVNTTERALPEESLETRLTSAALRRPNSVAVSSAAGDISYRELHERSNRLARYLSHLGIGAEHRVALFFHRELDLIVAMLAVLKSGAVYLPLDPGFPKDWLSFALKDAEVRAVLTKEDLCASLPANGTEKVPIVCLDRDRDRIGQLPSCDLPIRSWPDNPAYAIYTSGSTGRPKGVLVTRRGLMNYVDWACAEYPCGAGARIPLHSSPSFDLVVTSIWPPLVAGGTIVVMPESGFERLAGAAETYAVMKATPSQLLALEGYLPDRPGHALARCFVVGGEALMWEDVSRWRVLAPQARIVNEYGPTETVVGSCVYEAPERHGIGPVPIGRPIANTRVYIVDRWGQLAPTTSTGELYIGGIGVARGYCGQPALTAERFLPDAFGTDPGARLYRTGDLARWNSHGQIEYLGRLDDQIKLRGYRIELGEIEAVLRQHGAVHQCAVVLLEGTARKQLVCYAVRKSGTAITGPELLQYLAGKLPEYMIPSAMVLLESLPLTPNGKVDRKALPRPSMGTGSSREYVAPRTPAEELLAGIWGQALRLTRVGVHDNFFELGGDSILTIQIVSRANQAGLRIAPRDMFQNQTIAELASVAAKVQAIESSTVATGTLPLTPIQQWFFEQNIHRPQHFNQSALLKPSHDLKSGQVMAALRSVLDHHDVLRTRFSYDEEKWKQRTGAEETNTVYTFVDLSALDAGCQPSAIEMAAGELQASLDFERGPLLRMAQFQLGLQEPGRLLIILHHLIVDAVSWSILLEDFEMALDQIQRGETVRLAEKTTSFRQWVLALEKYADSPELLQESAIWTAMETASVAPLPRDYKEGNNTAGSARTISLRLTAEQTQILLQEAPRTHRIQIEEVILAALARALCEWAGQPVVAVHVEGHGREDIQPEINLTRTVGWFTTLHPALLTIAQDANAEQQLRDIKEQLRAIPRRGLGFGVLRYVAKGPVREILTRVPTPEVSFNYLGNAALGRSEAFTSAPETPGATQSSEASRFHTFDVTAAIDNGRLLVIWTYSENLHSSTTVQRIAGRFQAAVEDYLTCLESFPAAGPSPADFPLSGLDREQLESVLQQFKQHVRSQKA